MERVTSAAAERNKQPIAEQLLQLLPAHGSVLEIAAGSGQHVVHFAAAMPGILWQPSDRLLADLENIAARRAASGLANIAAPVRLDVLEFPWPLDQPYDALVCINMIHISAWETTAALFAGAAAHLSGAGLVVLYGPYREGGRHTAPSNEEFDAWLRTRDPGHGVRNLEDVDTVADAAGFARFHLARLPANNLLLAFRRDG